MLDSATVAAAAVSGGSLTCPPNGSAVCASQASPATCPSNAASPAITVAKNCSTVVNLNNAQSIAVTVNFNGSVCNASSFAVSGLAGTDVQTFAGNNNTVAAGTVSLSGTSLSPCPSGVTCTTANQNLYPGTCVTYTGSYSPAHISGPASGATACNAEWDDKLTVTGNTILGTGTASNFGTASCPLCGCQ